VAYSGDGHTSPGSSSSTVQVVGHESHVAVRATPERVIEDRTRVTLHITVDSNGSRPTGTVTVRAAGETYVARLRHGRAEVTLRSFDSPGAKSVTVGYGGDDDTQGSSSTIEIHVDKRHRGW
jgi:hypothetical protein